MNATHADRERNALLLLQVWGGRSQTAGSSVSRGGDETRRLRARAILPPHQLTATGREETGIWYRTEATSVAPTVRCGVDLGERRRAGDRSAYSKLHKETEEKKKRKKLSSETREQKVSRPGFSLF